jgi:hypothetical protein
MTTFQNINSYYLNYAASVNNPVERMKIFMTTTIGYLFDGHMFVKPLNPVLGETFQAKCVDGSKIYVEQTSHHPPVSHYYVEGPNSRYIFSGWSECIVKFGMTQITIN